MACSGAFSPPLPRLHAAPCIADQPPNEQPAAGQTVPTEFCLAGAAGQHYYLWRIPDSYAGRTWRIRLESLPGESTILLVQSIDHDPHQPGPLNVQTLWHGKSSPTSSNLATEALLLAPGLYGIVAATQQPPGLFRLYVAADAGPASTPASVPQPTAALPPVLERTATGGPTETIVPWTIDTAASATRWTLNLQTTAASDPHLRLSGPDEKELRLDTGRNDKAGRLHFPQLGLPPGAYKIAINAKPGAPLRLSINADGPRDSTHISQPDVAPATAFTFKPGAPLSGVFVQKGGVTDKQYVALTLDDSWQDKRFDLVLRALPNTRPERIQLGYLTSSEQDANVRGGPGEVRLDNLTLPPGRHVFSLLTSGGVSDDLPYSLTIENVSTRAAGQEQEPNDIAELANLVPPDGVITGESNGDSDTDYFRLNVSGPQQLWKLDCDCAGVDWLTVRGGNGDDIISVSQFPNGTLHLSSLLLARGDHIFRVRSTGAHYKLKFLPQGPAPVEAGGHPAALNAPPSSPDEIEPNDDPSLAMPLALNSSRAGMNDHGGDKDYYRFTLLGRTHIRLTLADSGAAGRHATLGWGADQRPLANLATSPTQQSAFWDGVLGAGDYYVMIRADNVDSSIYRIRLEPRNPFVNTETAPPPAIEATLTFAQKAVAAFSPYAQALTGQVTLVSKAAEPADLAVTPYAGDERWHVRRMSDAVVPTRCRPAAHAPTNLREPPPLRSTHPP